MTTKKEQATFRRERTKNLGLGVGDRVWVKYLARYGIITYGYQGKLYKWWEVRIEETGEYVTLPTPEIEHVSGGRQPDNPLQRAVEKRMERMKTDGAPL